MVNVAGKKLKKSKPKKSGFTYRPRKPEDVKKRAERRVGGGYDSIFKKEFDTFRPKSGDNAIRILPPTWDDHDHFGYTIFVHSWVGSTNSTYLCPLKMNGKRCPICEAAAEARKAGEEEEAKSLAVRENVVYWILDRDGDDPDKPMLYTVSARMDQDILSSTVGRHGKVLMIDHPDDGYDVIIKRTGTGLKTRYTAQIDRDSTPISDDEKLQEQILDDIQETPIPSVLHYYDAKYLDNVMSGAAEEEDEDMEEEDDEKEERSNRRTRKGKDRDDDDEDNTLTDDDEETSDDDDEDTEEDTRPSRRKKSRRGKTDDDDDETSDDDEYASTDDDEDERPSRSSRRGGRVERVARKSKSKDDNDDDETSDDDEDTSSNDDDDEAEMTRPVRRRTTTRRRSRR